MADATDDATAPTVVTVGTSEVEIVAAIPGRRRALLIQNTHASNDLYLGFGAGTVTTSNGIKVPAGGSFADNEPNCYSGQVRGIASGTGTPVRVLAF